MGGIIMMGLDYSALVVKRVGDKFQLQQITCKNADKDAAEEREGYCHSRRNGKRQD
jgi:hypothetical protein